MNTKGAASLLALACLAGSASAELPVVSDGFRCAVIGDSGTGGRAQFVVGGAAKLRAGNARRTEITDTAFDRDQSFLLLEIVGNTLRFQAVSRSGQTVDQGSITR